MGAPCVAEDANARHALRPLQTARSMRLRRCHALLVEPRETRELDLLALLRGQPRQLSSLRWFALTAHIDAEIELDPDEIPPLGSLSAESAEERSALEKRWGADVVARLLAKGLLVEAVPQTTTSPAASADQRLRSTHWRALSAVAHRHLRWRGVDSEEARASGALGERGEEVVERLGAPPVAALARLEECSAQPLPVAPQAGHAGLAQRRATCRNFDPSRPLPLSLFAQMLHTVYGAQGRSQVSGVPVLKKNSPSAGGLHPVEAYLLVQHVEGVAPGLYHYRADTHALEPLQKLDATAVREHASLFVARQPWFADAHVHVILAARFERNFWKYRNHAKAYRAVILDAGHLSQMQYLTATELGLGAFITAAINEGDIEDAFGLDPMQEGVIAVTGFGWRAERMDVLEFDPGQQVWPDWRPV